MNKPKKQKVAGYPWSGLSKMQITKPRIRVRADLELASKYYLNKARQWFKDNHIGVALDSF